MKKYYIGKNMWPKYLILSWNNFILEAETTNPFCLIIWTNVFKCFQCSSIEFEKIKTSSIYTIEKCVKRVKI